MKQSGYIGRVVKMFAVFALLSVFHMEVFSQPAENTVVITSDQMDACPGDPLSFVAVASKPLPPKAKYNWYVENGDTWVLSGVYAGDNTFGMNAMPDEDLVIKVVVEDGPKLKIESDPYVVRKSTNCAINICHQTTTGDYYGGTDFNPTGDRDAINWGTHPPTGLEEYFSEQGIVFESSGGAIVNQQELDIDLHVDDSLGVNPNNNFYVSSGELKPFKIRFPTNLFDKKYYNFTMRFYLIVPESCEFDGVNAQLCARTGHGTVTTDLMDVRFYDDGLNKLLDEQTIPKGADVPRYIFGQKLIDYHPKGQKKVYRFEMVYYGYMERPNLGLTEFEFQPEFGQIPNCVKIAVDYISAQAESVCMTPRSACVGEYITVNAAGFAHNADLVWKRYADNTYTTELPWGADEVAYHTDHKNTKVQADIKMTEPGSFYYSVQDVSKGESQPVRFTLVGRNCKISGPGIDGNENVCVTEYPFRQRFKARSPEIASWLGEKEKDYTFKWRILSPDGSSSDVTKVRVEESADKLSAEVVVEEGAKMSGDYTPDAPYKVVVGIHGITDGKVSVNPMGADTMEIWVYDKPNVSTLNFVTFRGEDDICAAYANDTIILQNKEVVEGYQWNFTGATMDADGTIHIDGFEKTALCNSQVASFHVALEVVNGKCVSKIEDEFIVRSTDDPTIDCSKMSAPTRYELRPSQLDTLVYLPIPDFSTSCDDDPALNVTVRYKGAESIHDIDSTFVLHKAQLNDREKLKFNLFAGKGTIEYSLVDGCGKSASCETEWAVVDLAAPAIDCGSILDFRIPVSKEDDCKAVPGGTEGFPVLKPTPLRDTLFTDTVIYVEGVYAGRSVVNPATDPGVVLSNYSKSIDLNAPYEIGVTYILWEYKDPSGNASYCYSSVTVVNENEVFSCESLSPIRVSVNENKAGLLYHYASAMPQNNPNPDTKYSLADHLVVPEPNPLYCGQVKLDILITGDCVDDDGEVIAVAKDSLLPSDKFLRHKFPIGLTSVTYLFITDNDTVSGKKDTVACEQQVIVASKDAPVPNDCPKDETLYVDENCLAKWNFSLDRVPTATIPYFKEVKYTYDKCSGDSYDYQSLGMSSALSKTYDTLGYPYMVRRISYLNERWERVADTTVVSECKNQFTQADKVSVKEVEHRNDDKSVCAKDAVETMPLMVTNFEELPSCITDDFGKGRHIIVWYYDNGKGVIDSCVTKFTVLDTIPPKKDCGKWGEESIFYCDTTCVVPASVVDLHVPSVDLLNASDNCTAKEDLRLTWERKFEGALVGSLEEAYPLGKTVITWTLTDEAGMQSFCVQTITVKDTLAPDVDCTKWPAIEVFADENCEVKADSVVKAGLSVPVIADDPCSPTGDSIKAVGTRYVEVDGALVKDGKDIFKDAYPKGVTYIYWDFEDAAHNKAQCIQTITVIDTLAPFFPDCSNLDSIVIELDPDSCTASLDLVKKRLGTLKAEDNCDGEIEGVPHLTLADMSYTDLPAFFKKDTVYKVSWVFTDMEGNEKVCHQDLEIRDVTLPDLDGVCQEPVKKVAAKVECSVSYDDLQLANPVVDDPCDGILYPEVVAYVAQKDGSVVVYRDEELKSARYPIGDHRFVWIYTDKAGLQDSCVMSLSVTDSLALQLSDCDVDKTKIVVLPKGECSLKASELANHIKFPSAWDICDEEYVSYRIERRFDGKLVVDEQGKPIVWDSEDFPLGKTELRWIFTDKLGVMKDSCDKTLIVKTELFDCSVLQPQVKIDLLEKFYATPEEVRLAGLTEPFIDFDNCDAAEISFSRSDGLSQDSNYQIGKTVVYWTFDYVFGDQKVCPQDVLVNDMVPPTLVCPPLENVSFECYGEIPAPYPSFEAFQEAGGSISDIRKYRPGTFGYEESDNGSSTCDYRLIRTYYVQDVRDSIITCSQEFVIHDVTAPSFVTKLDTLLFSCDQEIPSADSVVVVAADNCTPEDKIRYVLEVTDNRSSNPKTCEYNNYQIRREWTAIDTCGNVSAPLVQIVMIVDTVAPKFNLPADWKDTVVASNIKNCQRTVPPLGDLVRGYVSDECTDSEDVRIWQSPAPGTEIKEVTIAKIYAEDFCGNLDSLSLVVYLDEVKKVISLSANSLVVCGSDSSAINLTSNEVRMANGRVTISYGGEIISIPSVFTYDCYKDFISEENLVYSNNKDTYADRFTGNGKAETDSILAARTNLRKREQSGTYFFVAMDTITQCFDTASAYLTVHERPRVALASGTFYHCENDTLDVDALYSNYGVCLDDMGLEVTKSGWTIDGVDYEEGTSIPFKGKHQSMYFYAENGCGRSTSYDSYFTYCGVAPVSMQDSIDMVGSLDNLKLWRKDELHSRDSILFIVNQRYRSDSIFLAPSYPLDKNAIWAGDEVSFKLSTVYDPSFLMWKVVDGRFDGLANVASFDKTGSLLEGDLVDAEDRLLYMDDKNLDRVFKFSPEDTSMVYVLIGDGVCPAVPSNVFGLNVMDRLPTAFTPFDVDGMNDFFMKGKRVTIFDRYGQMVFQGDNGWDGSTPGGRVDPGVYFYDVQLNHRSYQGTIEVVYMK